MSSSDYQQPPVYATPLPSTPSYHCAACHWEGEGSELVTSNDSMEPGRCGQCGSQELGRRLNQ